MQHNNRNNRSNRKNRNNRKKHKWTESDITRFAFRDYNDRERAAEAKTVALYSSLTDYLICLLEIEIHRFRLGFPGHDAVRRVSEVINTVILTELKDNEEVAEELKKLLTIRPGYSNDWIISDTGYPVRIETSSPERDLEWLEKVYDLLYTMNEYATALAP